MDHQSHSFEPAQSGRDHPAKPVSAHEIQANPPLKLAPAQNAIQEGRLLADGPGDGQASIDLYGCEFIRPKRKPVAACVFAAWTLLAGLLFFCPRINERGKALAFTSIPSLLGAIWCFFARRTFRVRFTPRGVESFNPGESLEYQDIMEVFAPDRLSSPESFDIYLLHAYGCLCIPRTIRGNSGVIFDFLQSRRLAERDNPAVPIDLQQYLSKVTHAHGTAQVYVYRSHYSAMNPQPSRTREYVAGSMFIGGYASVVVIMLITMFVFGNENFKDSPWTVAIFMIATTTLLFGGFGCVVFIIFRWMAEVFANFQMESVLIVSPAGLAVQRGPKLIIATWEELRLGTAAGILLEDSEIRVWKESKRIKLRNNFQWPLRHAIERVRSYLN